jgi:hypothetical protein
MSDSIINNDTVVKLSDEELEAVAGGKSWYVSTTTSLDADEDTYKGYVDFYKKVDRGSGYISVVEKREIL